MEKIDFTNPDYEFDDIAEQVFYPIYDVIAQDLLEETGIVSGSMLDVGCGGGHLGFAVMGKSDLTGDFVDINATAVRLAEERSKRLGVWERSRFYRADVVSLPFEDQSFDLVISRGSMFFWEDQERAFSEIMRVLKPGGKTYIGGGLGRPWQRKAIMERMDELGLVCMGRQKDASMALTDGEYRSLAERLGRPLSIVDDEERGHWLVFEG